MAKTVLLWIKYALLTSVVFFAHWLSDISGVEGIVITNPMFGWPVLFVWYFTFLFVFGEIIHKVLKM